MINHQVARRNKLALYPQKPSMASFGSSRGGGRGGGGYGGGAHRFSSGTRTPHHSNKSNINSNSSSSSSSPTQPKLQVCRNFIATGSCPHGTRCNFSHVVRHFASVDVSDKLPPDAIVSGGRSGYRGGPSKPVKDRYKATSVAVWETSNGMIKLFTGSHDGKWRLYNTAPTTTTNHGGGGGGDNNSPSSVVLTKEFEHHVGGPVDTVHLVASHYFFVGFEISSPIEAPNDTNKAGMVHIWNLNVPQDPPLELMIHGSMAKFAASGRIRCLCTATAVGDGRVWSGGNDGVIREWAFSSSSSTVATGTTGGFSLVRCMSGHLGAVSKLALCNGVLWSGGVDGTIRLWNIENGEMAHLIPAIKKETGATSSTTPYTDGGAAVAVVPTMAAGHSGSITGLLTFEIPSSDPSNSSASASLFVITSSLDETVKVWNATNGECVASEKHGQGVTSIALTSDPTGQPLLLCGLYYGDIMIRGTISNPPLCLLLKISHNFVGVGHEIGPVHDVQAGPGHTFYAVGEDGKLTVWQIVGAMQ